MMTLFERLRNGSSSEPTTANSANPAIPANSATQLAEIAVAVRLLMIG